MIEQTLWFVHLVYIKGSKNIVGPFDSDDTATQVAKNLASEERACWEVHPVQIKVSK